MIVPRILLLAFGVMGLVNCKRMKPAAVKFNKITSTFDAKNLEFLNTFVTPGSNSQTFELNSTLIRNISSDLRVHIQLMVKSTEMGVYKKIFAYEVDVCKFWEGSVKLVLVKSGLQNIKKFSNFQTTCPVSSGYYYIKSFKVEPRSVPVFVMEGEYMVIATH